MPTRSEIISKLFDPGVIAIIRTDTPEKALPVCEALLAGGLMAAATLLGTPESIPNPRLAKE